MTRATRAPSSDKIARATDRLGEALIEFACITEIMQALGTANIAGITSIEGTWVKWLGQQVDNAAEQVRGAMDDIEALNGRSA